MRKFRRQPREDSSDEVREAPTSIEIIKDWCQGGRSAPLAILLADGHYHHLPSWRLNWLEQFTDELLACPFKVPLILMGDVTELHDNIDARVSNLVIKLVTNWAATHGQVIWISGQHDSYRPGESSFWALANEHITIVDRDVLVNLQKRIAFVPFCRDLQQYEDLLAKVPDGYTVFTHLPLKEVLEKVGAKEPKAIPVKAFKRFKKVWAGDIHQAQAIGNFEYVGALSQRDWRDAGVLGCLGLLKSWTGDLDRLYLRHPQHIKVNGQKSLSTVEAALTDGYTPFVRVTGDVGRNKDKVVKQLGELGVSPQLDADAVFATVDTDKVITQHQTDEELLQEVLDSTKLVKGKIEKEYLAFGLSLLGDL